MRGRTLHLLLSILLLLLTSCAEAQLVPAPLAVRSTAVEIAHQYLDMPCAWGGQSFWWEQGGTVDCSGLIINIFKEAGRCHGYVLSYEDATAKQLQQHSVPVATPESGDVIFMGADGEVTHIALFLEQSSGTIHFIDAYSLSGKVEKR